MTDDETLRQWFVGEVLPLERALERFVRRNLRLADDVVDVRQDIYERALAGAKRGLPGDTRSYTFTIARNVLIDRARRGRVISFDQIADLDSLPTEEDLYATDRHLTARDELRRAMKGLDNLPPRCREVVRLRKVEGLSINETAARLGVGHHTIERQLTLGLRALANFMLGGDGRIERPVRRPASLGKAER